MTRPTFDEAHKHELGTDATERQISLLVALLVRYPEIGTVRVAPVDATLGLSFLLEVLPGTEALDAFRKKLELALGAFSRLVGGPERHVRVHAQKHDVLATLEVTRDLKSLAAEEFPILLGIVKQAFGDLLIVDDEQRGETDGDDGEDFPLAHTLEDLRATVTKRKLIGFRDGGRVLVFNEA